MTKLLLTCVDKRRSVIRGAFACAVIIKYRRSSANQSQPARYVNGSLCAGINKGCVLNLRSPAKIAESQRTSVETAGVHTDRVTMNKSWYSYNLHVHVIPKHSNFVDDTRCTKLKACQNGTTCFQANIG